jgi:S1-C subfamily serine protease
VRNRLLPRTVLGLAMMVLAASVGAAFSGVVLYSYYEYRLSKTTDRINALSSGYQKAFANATADLNAERSAAETEIAKELAPLRQFQTGGAALSALVRKVAPAMYFVHTLDQNGQASVGSAFVVASDPSRSLLLTSYATVAAATRRPGPDLYVRQGSQDTRVTLWTWDPRYDLALIVLAKGNLPALTPAPAAPAPGDTVFAVSGLGSLGASAAQGVVTDVSAQGIEHTAPVGQAFQGGPVVDSAGQVVAVASRSYSPLSFVSDGVRFAPYERSACAMVLSCPGGILSSQPVAPRTG